MNTLEQIFKQQLKFQKLIGPPFDKINTKRIKEKEKLSDIFLLSIIDEIIELRNIFNKKAWVKKRFKVDRKRILEELSDIYLFLINLTILWNMTPEKLLKAIQSKQNINLQRLNQDK